MFYRFQSVRRRFMGELKELRFKEVTPAVAHNIIALLMGMKFFRVKVQYCNNSSRICVSASGFLMFMFLV